MPFTVKSNRDGTFYVSHSSGQSFRLIDMRIKFPEITLTPHGSTERMIAGPPVVTIVVRAPNGKQHTATNVPIQW